MATIVDELVRIGAFKSKNEARTMIKNKGVSFIPCICEDFETPCFEAETEPMKHIVMDDTVFNPINRCWEPSISKIKFPCEKQIKQEGFILSPNGTHIPATKWDITGWNIHLAHFRENLVHGECKGFVIEPTEFTNHKFVLTWNIEEFGKNPWLVTDEKMLCEFKSGDVIKVGKNRTITVV